VHEDHRNLYHKWVICGVRAVTVTSALSSYKHFIHVTPAPVLARLKGLHHGMLGLMKVLGSVFVLGRVTTADVTADETFPQMDPGIAHLQAFLAAFAAGLDLANFFYVGTGRLCT
jgi:hypothetical protein